MRPIVLASSSARRRDLLSLLGLPFVVLSVPVDETPRADEPPDRMALRLSATKAAAVRAAAVATAAPSPDSLIVGADTVVVLGDRVFGKPVDAADAIRMLQALRGSAHVVHSAVAVVEAGSGRAAIRLSSTTVWMRDYSDTEIERYVVSGDPLDKAGAYAIQHAEFQPVARIDGCYTGVVGLPLGALLKNLAHFGVFPSVPGGVTTACRGWTGQSCCLEAVHSGVGSR